MSYKKRTSNIGKVYKARTQYIDKDTKRTRSYVVRDEVNGKVKVSKLKSIKQFDESGKNIDPHLTEINHTRYGLEKRTGVDNQVFSQNRITKKPLMLSDKKVFFKQEEEFTLGSHDWSRIQNSKNKKKEIRFTYLTTRRKSRDKADILITSYV